MMFANASERLEYCGAPSRGPSSHRRDADGRVIVPRLIVRCGSVKILGAVGGEWLNDSASTADAVLELRSKRYRDAALTLIELHKL